MDPTTDQLTALSADAHPGPVVMLNLVRYRRGDDAGDAWDYAVLVRYPHRQAFVDTMTSPEYAAINPDRLAGLEGHVILPVSETYSKFPT